MYICETFVCFRSYLFARAPFGQKLKAFTGEGRPDRVVEVWTRSDQCGARGGRSNCFCRRQWINRRFPGFSVCGLIHFRTYQYDLV